MADLQEGFELCKIPNGVEFLGAERHCEEDYVILTFGNREVRVYNIVDRKIVRSWSVEPKQKLSCPAVQDFSTKKYFIVQNERELLIWNDSVTDLRKSEIIQLPKPIKRIQTCFSSIFHHEPVIVFKDNEVLPISFVGKKTEKNSKGHSHRLLWSGFHKTIDEKIWFCKILTFQGFMKALLVMQSFEPPLAGKQQVYNINPPAPEERLLCGSTLNDGELSLFVSLWSDGCLYKTDIPAMKDMDSELGEIKETILECELVSSLSEISLSTLEASSMYLSNVSSSFVCVAGAGKVPGESQVDDVVSIWDMKFGTLHSCKALRNFANSPAETHVTKGICHLQCMSSFVIVANSSSVLACSYTTEQPILRNSLGMLHAINRKNQHIKPQFLGTPRLIRFCQSVQDWTNRISTADENEDKLLGKLLDAKKTRTAKELTNELQNYFQEKLRSKSNPEGSIDRELKQLSKRQQKVASRPPVVSQYFVTSVFERCFEEKELWSEETGNFLLKTKVLPPSCLSQFLELVCENNQIKLLHECFQIMNGIPETSVVGCLKYILRVGDDILASCDSPEEWVQTNAPCSLSKAKYLCLIIAYPINDVFMQESLKRLNFEETLLFIKFLLYTISCWTPSLQNWLKLEDFTHKLSYVQILDWAGLTLNAHFTQLILLPEAQTLLVNLHQAVAEQINTFEHLEQLEGYLTHFKNHEPLPRKDCLGAYTIESMEF